MIKRTEAIHSHNAYFLDKHKLSLLMLISKENPPLLVNRLIRQFEFQQKK